MPSSPITQAKFAHQVNGVRVQLLGNLTIFPNNCTLTLINLLLRLTENKEGQSRIIGNI